MTISEIPIDQMTYEQAFTQLESLVQRLETNQLTLEESASLFETGQTLVRRCAALLEEAELRIQTLQTNLSDPSAKTG
jgi:exodeoxyribonuclease VII small subunit